MSIPVLTEDDRRYVESEIQGAQTRVMQTLVPTILSLGLIAICNTNQLGRVSMGCAFGVLFSSSLYVAALSYKIFRNGAFLAAFPPAEKPGALRWERLLTDFNEQRKQTIIQAETPTAAVIYAVLALTFLFIFVPAEPVLACGGTAVLLVVSLLIFSIYRRKREFKGRWTTIKEQREGAGRGGKAPNGD